jgi:hypothetical protein
MILDMFRVITVQIQNMAGNLLVKNFIWNIEDDENQIKSGQQSRR